MFSTKFSSNSLAFLLGIGKCLDLSRGLSFCLLFSLAEIKRKVRIESFLPEVVF